MIWTTTIHAMCPLTGEMKEFVGPNVEAPSRKLAKEYCQKNGLGYCHIQGILIEDGDKIKHSDN